MIWKIVFFDNLQLISDEVTIHSFLIGKVEISLKIIKLKTQRKINA